jgi:uncharacterized protein (TIGR02597 family)
MNIPRFSLAVLLASSVLLTGANAETTATTDPVGFTTMNVRAKTTTARALTMIVLPMERADAYTGSCSAASFSLDGSNRTVITFASDLFTANQFTGNGNQHYFRLNSGANAGEFSTIISNALNSITLADNLNAVLATTSTFSVTPYWTLGTALPSGGGLQGGTSAAGSTTDNLILYNVNFVGTTYFYNTTNNRWQAGPADASNTLIPPGTGFAVERKQNSAVSIVLPGSVPLGTSSVDINGSSSGTATRNTLVGNAYPLASRRLADIGLYTGSSTTGVFASTSATSADTVGIFNPTTGVQTTYFYSSTNNRWQTGPADASNITIPEGAAVLIARKNGRAPFTWYIPQPAMALN